MAHGNELNSKKYFWLKLDRHFFGNARIKKLRKLAGGDTYTIIYLKLMLLSIEYNGLLVYEGIEDTFEKEMATKLDEDDENVLVTINYLKLQGLLEERNDDAFLPEAANSIGGETKNNVYKRKRSELVGKIPTKFQPNSNQIPIEIEKDIEIDIKESVEKKARFTPPTTEEVKAYIATRKTKINADRFINYYESNGWKVGKNPMKDWRAAVRTWEQPKEEQTQSVVKTYETSELNKLFGNLTYEEI